jgi:hypothetical protein
VTLCREGLPVYYEPPHSSWRGRYSADKESITRLRGDTRPEELSRVLTLAAISHLQCGEYLWVIHLSSANLASPDEVLSLELQIGDVAVVRGVGVSGLPSAVS